MSDSKDLKSCMDSLSQIEKSIMFAASDVWQAPDVFRKKSQQLWIEMNRVKKQNRFVSKVTVRNVIPESRLATYVDSPYDLARELSYANAADAAATTPAIKVPDANEPWLLPEVDELWQKFETQTRVIHSVSVAQWIQKLFPQLAKQCQPYRPDLKNVVVLPCLELCNLKELELQMRITLTRNVWVEVGPLVLDLPMKHGLLNPFLLRSVQEWQNQVLNDVRGIPELTRILRKTRFEQEGLLKDVDSNDLKLSLGFFHPDSDVYQLWNRNTENKRLYKDVI